MRQSKEENYQGGEKIKKERDYQGGETIKKERDYQGGETIKTGKLSRIEIDKEVRLRRR